MWHRYSDALRQAVLTANDDLTRRGDRDMSTRHLLMGIWKARGHGHEILRRLGVDQTSLQDAFDGAKPREEGGSGRCEPGLTNDARAMVDRAYVLARDIKDQYVGDEHFLISMLMDPIGSDAGEILMRLDLSVEVVVHEVVDLQKDRLHAPAASKNRLSVRGAGRPPDKRR